jgi:protein-tyrosine-phosphatase
MSAGGASQVSSQLVLPQAVLFVCNHNIVRSVMAEGLMRRRFAKRIWVESAGVRAGLEPDPFVAVVMDELGVDVTRHRPRAFADLEDSSYDLIVTLTPQAHHRALEFTRSMAVDVEYWPTFDPTDAAGSREQRLEEYRGVRDALDGRIAERFAEAST